MLNEDAYSVKGCQVIYAPKGQAGEYSKLAANPYRGCGHECIYCYVPAAIRISRDAFDHNVFPKAGFLERLTKDAAKYRAHRITEQVMLSFTTDPYCLIDVAHHLTRRCLTVLRDHGSGFCTLTKGGARALLDIDLFSPDRDAFSWTITTLTPDPSPARGSTAPPRDDRLPASMRCTGGALLAWLASERVCGT